MFRRLKSSKWYCNMFCRAVIGLWPRNMGSYGYVANRSIRTLDGTKRKWELTITDKSERDGYSREELYCMLKLIRAEEKRQGWKVPEPEGESS